MMIELMRLKFAHPCTESFKIPKSSEKTIQMKLYGNLIFPQFILHSSDCPKEYMPSGNIS